jgi:DNA adenine methylase
VHYTGSKANHAKEILNIVLANRQPCQAYVEPFIGGANVMVQVPADRGPRIGADLNQYMIALHRALAAGWQPPTEVLPKAKYLAMAEQPDDYPPELVAFFATGISFGSMWFSTYVADDPEMRHRLAREACLRDAPGLVGVDLRVCSYDELEIPPESIIYCDPPYLRTEGYAGATRTIAVGESSSKNMWRADKFWRWADARADEGHQVFVSEYRGPAPSAFGSRIGDGVPPDLKRELDEANAAGRAAMHMTSRDREEARARIEDVEDRISATWGGAGGEMDVGVGKRGGGADRLDNGIPECQEGCQ